MDTEERKQLVLRNTTEIVTEQELDEVLEKESPNTYVGYETSGPVHLGHWASIRKLSDLQKAGFNVKVLFADLHTYLNKKGEEDWIQAMTEYWEATFEACGLEAEFIRGREFQEKTEYFHDVLDLATSTTINRGQRSMSEVASGDEDSRAVSQIIYPLMQALDIEYLDVDLAMGATDQRKIHMLAREALPKIGYRKPTCLHHPLVVSLQGTEKMSSSKPKTMFPLHAAEETVKERIKDAYCPAEELEENPVLQISRFHIFGDDEELKIERPEKYGGNLEYSEFENLQADFESGELHPQDLKNAVAEHIAAKLKPVREKFKENPELLKPLEDLEVEMPEYY
ncbi:tyrosine--tRNA ligase [Candidatus Nanohalococcus occultus]|uniref:tyrosine--tRNA ligase n=1 Tax=Candidatus Nanohalococcus occultus TaxID=2978047 RepID=UPI0039DF5714